MGHTHPESVKSVTTKVRRENATRTTRNEKSKQHHSEGVHVWSISLVHREKWSTHKLPVAAEFWKLGMSL